MKTMLIRAFLFLSLAAFTGCGDSASVSALSTGISEISDMPSVAPDNNLSDGPTDAPTDNPPKDNPPKDNPPPQVCVAKKLYTVSKITAEGRQEIGNVKAYDGALPSLANYNYFSWSAHPVVGPTLKGYQGSFFLYEGADGLSFNFIYDVDGGGSQDNQVRMTAGFEGNELADKIIISDDKAEVVRSVKGANTNYVAKFRYWKNTDGAAIGPIKSSEFKLKINIQSLGDTRNVHFFSEDGKLVNLGVGQYEVSLAGQGKTCYQGDKDPVDVKNQCIDRIYQVHKTRIEKSDAWITEYEQVKKIHIDKIEKLKKTQAIELEEYKKTQTHLVKVEEAKIVEIQKLISSKKTELVKYYETKLVELEQDYKGKKDVLVYSFDEKIKEIQKEESRKQCRRSRGFFGFLKRIFCHVVRLAARVLSLVFHGLDQRVDNFLFKIGLMNKKITSSKQLIALKVEAVTKLEVEYSEKRKKLILEKEEKLKALEVESTRLVTEQKRVIEVSYKTKSANVTAFVERQKEVLKAYTLKLARELRALKAKLIKEQNEAHIAFMEEIKVCK